MFANNCLPLSRASNDKKRSDQICEQLARDKRNYGNSRKIILLGIGRSGKSIILKQMENCQRFYPKLEWETKNEIKKYVVDAIVTMLSVMPSLTPPVKLDSLEHEAMAEWILNNAKRLDLKYNLQFYRHVEILWQDRGVQTAYRRGNEFDLGDNVDYFLERINEISKNDYIPTEEDMLRCPIHSTYVREALKFWYLWISKVLLTFRIVDVGRHNLKRLQFVDFNRGCIMFIIDCSSYDVVSRDSSKNRLRESLEFFKTALLHWPHTFIFVVLNKQDIFKKKILSGRKG